jgi:hypothetical protein
MDSQLAKLAAMYLTSAELSDIESCFLLNKEITVDPKMKQHHEVLFVSISLPSQSESEYPCNFTPSPTKYLKPYPTMTYKHMSTFFAAIP